MHHYNYSHIPATFITFLPISHLYTYKEEKQRMCSFAAVWFLFAFSLWHMCTHILNILVFMPFSAVMYSALLGESPRPITSQMGSYVILPECSRSALGCALSWTGPEYVPREETWRHPDETETTQMLLSFEVLPVTNTLWHKLNPDCEDKLVPLLVYSLWTCLDICCKSCCWFSEWPWSWPNPNQSLGELTCQIWIFL